MKRSILFALLMVLIPVFCQAMEIALTCDPNTETDLAGYRLYYGTKAGGPYTKYAQDFPYGPGVVPEFKLTLPDGLKYLVARAYDKEGLESPYSNEVNTDGSPKAPGSLKLKSMVLILTPGN
jgi:hypothetical protein